MAWHTPKTWAVGDVLTAADMNSYVRDNAKAQFTPSDGWPTDPLMKIGSFSGTTNGAGVLSMNFANAFPTACDWAMAVASSGHLAAITGKSVSALTYLFTDPSTAVAGYFMAVGR